MEPDCVGIFDGQRMQTVCFPKCREFDENQCETSVKAGNDQMEAMSDWCTASTGSKNITIVLSLGMKRFSRAEPADGRVVSSMGSQHPVAGCRIQQHPYIPSQIQFSLRKWKDFLP